jgi:hypothetical protein
MTASEAFARLRASRDAERDAPIWRDNGRSVAALAMTAGVRVTYAHVTLGKELTTQHRTVEGQEVNA